MNTNLQLLRLEIGISCFVFAAMAVGPTQALAQSDSESIARAIDGLSNRKFSKRQSAYRLLVRGGGNSIAALEIAATDDDFNVAERCVKALTQISKDPESTEAAFEALQRLAANKSSKIAKLAQSDLKRLRMTEEERAVEALKSAGVQIRPGRDGKVSSIAISRDQDLYWLKFLPSLRYVSLSQPNVTDKGIDQLVDCEQIYSLSLYGTSVTDLGLSRLGKLASLTSLSLSGGNFSAAGISQLKSIKRLSNFSWQSRISHEELEAVSELKQIRTLSLSGLVITEKACEIISGIEQLEHVRLTLTGLTDRQCLWLPRIQTSMRLSLMKSPKLTATGWETISHLDLRSLMVYATPITDEEMQYVGSITSLTTLSISDAAITDEGLQKLKTLTSLRYISLRGTDVTQEGADRLKKVLPKLSSVRVSPNGFNRAMGAAAVPPYTVRTFGGKKYVYVKSALTEPFFKKLQKETNIYSVSMSGGGATDENIKRVAQIPMENLSIRSDVVSDAGIAALEKNISLKILTLTSPLVTDESVKMIANLPSITSLSLQKAELTDVGTQELIKHYAEQGDLKTLELKNCPQITNQSLEGLGKISSLSSLVLADNPGLTGSAMKSVAELPNLSSLSFQGTVIEAADFSHLTTSAIFGINLRGSQLGIGSIDALADARPKLASLIAAKTNLTDEEIGAIVKLKSLQFLSLEQTKISDAVFDQLDGLKLLRTLTVSAENVSDTDATQFSQRHPGISVRRK